jgi:hypothetical protein
MSPELSTALEELSTHHRSGRFYGILSAFQQEVGDDMARECVHDLVGALWNHFGKKGWTVRITDHDQRAAMKRLLVMSPGLGRMLSMAGATVVGKKLPPADHGEVAAFIESKLGNLRPEPRRRR